MRHLCELGSKLAFKPLIVLAPFSVLSERIGCVTIFRRGAIEHADLLKRLSLRRLMPMAITLDAIVEEAAQLPGDVVAELVERILIGCHGGIKPEVEAAWKTETRHRVAEITSGKVEGIPLEESLARAARALRP